MTPKTVRFWDAHLGAPFALEGSVVSQHDGTVPPQNSRVHCFCIFCSTEQLSLMWGAQIPTRSNSLAQAEAVEQGQAERRYGPTGRRGMVCVVGRANCGGLRRQRSDGGEASRRDAAAHLRKFRR